MRFSVPHPIPYQGSKRRLATAILSHVSGSAQTRLVEPFAGSAAVTLAAAYQNKFSRFVVADRLEPLVSLWKKVVAGPAETAAEYEALWTRERQNPIQAYYDIRREFNADRDPSKLLYLLARCVKNAVRFNPAGDFNQSPDKRRTGTRPDAMKAELFAAHRVLIGRCEAVSADFMELIKAAELGDLFYLDPPYQGTSEGRDSRYIGGVSRERIIEALRLLNNKKVPFILSYDGESGGQVYGDPLPPDIASRVLLDVGRSSQATLNGQNHTTVESLYISTQLSSRETGDTPVPLKEFEQQQAMSFV